MPDPTADPTTLHEVFAGMSGGTSAAEARGLLNESGFGEIPAPLLAEAIASYAGTAPIEVAEHLAPFAVAQGPLASFTDGSPADAQGLDAGLDLLTSAPLPPPVPDLEPDPFEPDAGLDAAEDLVDADLDAAGLDVDPARALDDADIDPADLDASELEGSVLAGSVPARQDDAFGTGVGAEPELTAVPVEVDEILDDASSLDDPGAAAATAPDVVEAPLEAPFDAALAPDDQYGTGDDLPESVDPLD